MRRDGGEEEDGRWDMEGGKEKEGTKEGRRQRGIIIGKRRRKERQRKGEVKVKITYPRK